MVKSYYNTEPIQLTTEENLQRNISTIGQFLGLICGLCFTVFLISNSYQYHKQHKQEIEILEEKFPYKYQVGEKVIDTKINKEMLKDKKVFIFNNCIKFVL